MSAPVAALDVELGVTREIVEHTPIAIGEHVVRHVAIEKNYDGFFVVLTGLEIDSVLDLWIQSANWHEYIADARHESAGQIAEAQCAAAQAAKAITPKEVTPC